jgi:hypothetical protein
LLTTFLVLAGLTTETKRAVALAVAVFSLRAILALYLPWQIHSSSWGARKAHGLAFLVAMKTDRA